MWIILLQGMVSRGYERDITFGYTEKLDKGLGVCYTMDMCASGAKKRPIYTDHARDQMAERGISKEEVGFCLNEPEITRPGDGDTLILTAHPNGRYIKIVVPKNKPRVIITTAD